MQHYITVLKLNAFSSQCHFYHYFLCVGVCVLVAQLCPALCEHMDCSPPGSSVHGILQARVLEWVAISSSRGTFPIQGSKPGLSHFKSILYHLTTRESHRYF